LKLLNLQKSAHNNPIIINIITYNMHTTTNFSAQSAQKTQIRGAGISEWLD